MQNCPVSNQQPQPTTSTYNRMHTDRIVWRLIHRSWWPRVLRRLWLDSCGLRMWPLGCRHLYSLLLLRLLLLLMPFQLQIFTQPALLFLTFLSLALLDLLAKELLRYTHKQYAEFIVQILHGNHSNHSSISDTFFSHDCVKCPSSTFVRSHCDRYSLITTTAVNKSTQRAQNTAKVNPVHINSAIRSLDPCDLENLTGTSLFLGTRKWN